jgi:hypothetical protein
MKKACICLFLTVRKSEIKFKSMQKRRRLPRNQKAFKKTEMTERLKRKHASEMENETKK